jgi:hypothetical protein
MVKQESQIQRRMTHHQTCLRSLPGCTDSNKISFILIGFMREVNNLFKHHLQFRYMRIHWCIYLFNHSFNHLFIHLFIHSSFIFHQHSSLLYFILCFICFILTLTLTLTLILTLTLTSEKKVRPIESAARIRSPTLISLIGFDLPDSRSKVSDPAKQELLVEFFPIRSLIFIVVDATTG